MLEGPEDILGVKNNKTVYITCIRASIILVLFLSHFNMVQI